MSAETAMVDVGELTRASYLSGISAQKWLVLLQSAIKNTDLSESQAIGGTISSTLLEMFASLKTEALINYFRVAILSGIVDLANFVAVFLAIYHTASPETLSGISSLAQLILEIHFTSSKRNITTDVHAIRPSLSLLHAVYFPPMSPFDPLIQPISQLVILILSCVQDMGQMPTAEAAQCYTLCSDILQIYHLPPDIRTALEAFIMSLGFLLGDETKAAREAEMLHTLHMSNGKHHVVNPAAGSSIAALSLILHHLILNRGSPSGCGNDPIILSTLLSYYRTASLTLATFYMQIILSSMILYAGCAKKRKSANLYQAFILGRLPGVIKGLESEIRGELGPDADPMAAVEAAVFEIFHTKAEVVSQCDLIFEQSLPPSEEQKASTFRQHLMNALRNISAISHPFARSVLSGNLMTQSPSISSDAKDANVGIDIYVQSKFSPDVSSDELQSFLHRACGDPSVHALLSQTVVLSLISSAKAMELDHLHLVCKCLSSDDHLMEIVALHASFTTVLAHCLVFIDDFECETVGDPQSAVTHLGVVVLLVQSIAQRYQLRAHNFAVGERQCCTTMLFTRCPAPTPLRLKAQDPLFAAWINALFDQSSDGIEDNLLRRTKLQSLLHFAPALVFYAILAKQGRVIDIDVWKSGLSYFHSGLLDWTLTGVVNILISEIVRLGYSAPMHLEALIYLVRNGNNNCPRLVLLSCGHKLSRLLSDRRMATAKMKYKINDSSIRQALEPTLLLDGSATTPTSVPKVSWSEIPRLAIRDALAAASSGNAPTLDLCACIQSIGATGFVDLLWSELSSRANLGDPVGPRQVGLFSLTAVLPPPYPPLLLVFLNHTVPLFVSSYKTQEQALQDNIIDLLAALIASSLLMAVHYERATATLPSRPNTTQAGSTNLARRLFSDLQDVESHTSKLLAQQIMAFPTFSGHFTNPMASHRMMYATTSI